MRTLTLAIMLCAALALALPHAACAATFTVDSTRDDNDVSPGDGVCATVTHDCTLRAAIREANALAGADTITLPAGRFSLSIQGAHEDAGMTGDLDITDDLVINGAGESSTIIDGKHIDGVFDVHDPAAVTLSGLTITNGRRDEDGGGMFVFRDASVTLIHVTFLRNRVHFEGWGGGLANFGTAALAHVTLLANRAGDADLYDPAGDAGGMWNAGTATLTDVTFRANRAGDGILGGVGGDGGGLMNEGPATLTDVTFSLNRAGDGCKRFEEADAGGNGGGMFNDDTATLTRVTFDRNRAGNGAAGGAPLGVNSGGGLYSDDGTVTLNDVVFVRNRAGRDGSATGEGGGGGSGGGMSSFGSATLTNVTFDQNRAGSARGRDSLGGYGGAMDSDGVTLTNVTVTRNRAGNGGDGGWGGGLSLSAATLTNVTVADNRAGRAMLGGEPGQGHQIAGDASTQLTNTIVFGPGISCNVDYGSVVSLGHNLDSGMSCGFAAAGDLSNTDPRLEPTGRTADLQNHGGFTPTLALLPGSPAIDAGDNAACPATDQRGITRPQGAACDIGAYEFQP